MVSLKQFEVWFVTGSQHLYGEETLKQVAEHSQIIAKSLMKHHRIPVAVVFKPTVKTPEEIYARLPGSKYSQKLYRDHCMDAYFFSCKNVDRRIKDFAKAIVHLHTQFNRDIPWNDIDMDFMNLNQSAHGDREFGFMMTRMRINRKVVVGHWQDEQVLTQIGVWARAAAGWNDWQGAKFVRFGDNMRYVAVTDGDKVEAEMKFGFSVNTHGIGDLVKVINEVSDADIDYIDPGI